MPAKNDHAETIWSYLEAWHPNEAHDRRAEVEWRVDILATLGRDPVKIYAALSAGVRILKAHKQRVRSLAGDRRIAKHQLGVWRDLDRAIKSLEEWNETWMIDEHEYIDDTYIDPDGPGHNPMECLRVLRRDFERSPLPIFGRRIDGKVVDPRMRLSGGRPWLHKRPSELLRRAHVPKEERAALLKALGLF